MIADYLEQSGIPSAHPREGVWESLVKVQLPDETTLDLPVLVVLFRDDFGETFAPFPGLNRGSDSDQVSRLARLNDRTMAVKFALDADGDWELVLDVPTDSLDRSAFEKSLRRLALYAGACSTEISSPAVTASPSDENNR